MFIFFFCVSDLIGGKIRFDFYQIRGTLCGPVFIKAIGGGKRTSFRLLSGTTVLLC